MASHVLVYDADCGFCRWSLGRVLAWDRRRALAPLALQEPEADRLLAELDPEARAASWHLITPSGNVLSAGAAVAPLLDLLPGGRPLAAAARRAPRLVERGYRLVADHRSLLGRLITNGAASRARARIEARSGR